MTDHSDLIAELRAVADQHGNTALRPYALYALAASALSSQSLSLSEARSRGDAFKAAIEVAIGLFPHVRDDATQHALCVLRNALASSVLENGPAVLADANTKSPDPSLSSLRKGAEVAVKPLEWLRPPTNITLSRAETILGSYAVWTHHEADGDWFWSGPPMPDNSTVCGAVASEGEAKSAAQSDFETRIRSALIGGGQ